MGKYEIHITIDQGLGNVIPAWTAFCDANSLKPLWILLSQGAWPSQVMCTANIDGTTEEAISHAMNLRTLIQQHFRVKRVKVETILTANSTEIPIYYEMHLKASVPYSKNELVRLLGSGTLGVSESILGPADGYSKMWLTERVYPQSHWVAHQAREALKQFSAAYDLYEPIASGYHAEVVVFDSNPAMDAGWIIGEPS